MIRVTLDINDVKFLLILLDNELAMPMTKEHATTVVSLIRGLNEAIEEES